MVAGGRDDPDAVQDQDVQELNNQIQNNEHLTPMDVYNQALNGGGPDTITKLRNKNKRLRNENE